MSEESSSVALVPVPKAEEPPGRGKYMESLKFLGIFADRVAALDADAWQRISERCAPLNGSSFEALIERAALFASQSAIGMIEPRSFVAAVLTNSARVAMATFALGNELALEFDPPSVSSEPPFKTGHAMVDLGIEAQSKITSALDAHVPGQRGVAVAMDAAAHAVKMLRLVPDAHFAALYAFIEPEIPFTSLEAEYKAMREIEGKSAEDAARDARRRADVDRFVRFVDRLEALSTEAWQRIDERCAKLNEDSFQALLDRVSFRMRSMAGWRARIAGRSSWATATNHLVGAVAATTMFTTEFANEFAPKKEPVEYAAERLARMDPDRRRSLEATQRMLKVLRDRVPNQRGTELAITAAAHAVQARHLWRADQTAESYSLVEPEIPLADLDHD